MWFMIESLFLFSKSSKKWVSVHFQGAVKRSLERATHSVVSDHLMWNRACEAWQGRVNIWQICRHRSRQSASCKPQKGRAVGKCFVWASPPPPPPPPAAAPNRHMFCKLFMPENCHGWRQAPPPPIQLEHEPEIFQASNGLLTHWP